MNIYSFINSTFNYKSIFFEIGCHFGTDTENLLFTSRNIHCFEPDYRNVQIFKKFNYPVTLNECAVSDIDGEIEFYMSSGNVYESVHGPTNNMLTNSNDWSASSSIKKPKTLVNTLPWIKFNKITKVRSQRIDTYCKENNINKIDFIWMDVQGAELDVLQGAGEFINNINYIYTEYNEEELYEAAPTKQQILDKLGPTWKVLFNYSGDMLIKNCYFTE